MTVKEQLRKIVDELDDERASAVLTFALRLSSPTNLATTEPASSIEPGVDVDRESLWQVARPFSADDPLWNIVGLLDGDGPADISADKHRYLATVYGDLHDE